jgi:hypothetical protein
MKIKNTLLLFTFLVISLFSTTFAQQRRLVGNLKLKNTPACADFYHFAGQSPDSPALMFYMSAGNEEETWMNIDGKDVRLKFVSKTKPTKPDGAGGELIGSRTTETYSAPNITVKITFTVSWLCAVGEPNCEAQGSTAIFRVRKGKRRQTVRAAGMSGC